MLRLTRTSVRFALCAIAWLAGCARERDPRPNIVIVSVDTLVPQMLRVYDAAAAAHPELDRFASESVVFENAFATASWTLPSHASIVTGLYSDRHGAVHETLGIDPSAPHLGQLLARAGYETVGFTDGVFLDASYGFGAGFERFDERGSDTEAGRIELPRSGAAPARSGESLFDRACAYLRQRSSERPFLLFVQTYSVHDYFEVRPWATRELAGAPLHDASYYVECLYGMRRASDEDWAVLRKLYRAEVEHLDRGFGELLAALARSGQADNTVVIFLSDHGEAFEPELQRVHHGGRLNRDQLHVPLVVRGPGFAPARRAEALSLVDVFATVLELARVPAPADGDGRSFVGALRGAPAGPTRALFAHEYHYRWSQGRRVYVSEPTTAPYAVAVIEGDAWFIDNARSADELYSLRDDAAQLANLCGESGDAERLRALAATRAPSRGAQVAVEGDAAQSERLRELGYVDR